MFNAIVYTFTNEGALSGNCTYAVKLPYDMTLLHMSASNSSGNTGALKIGNDSDDDAYMTTKNFGNSDSPSVAGYNAGGPTDWVGDDYPHIPAGTILLITVTNDTMSDLCIALTLSPG